MSPVSCWWELKDLWNARGIFCMSCRNQRLQSPLPSLSKPKCSFGHSYFLYQYAGYHYTNIHIKHLASSTVLDRLCSAQILGQRCTHKPGNITVKIWCLFFLFCFTQGTNSAGTWVIYHSHPGHFHWLYSFKQCTYIYQTSGISCRHWLVCMYVYNMCMLIHILYMNISLYEIEKPLRVSWNWGFCFYVISASDWWLWKCFQKCFLLWGFSGNSLQVCGFPHCSWNPFSFSSFNSWVGKGLT